MKYIIRIVLLVGFGFVIVAGLVLLPDAKMYRDCYKLVKEKVYQKGTISQKTYRSDEEMCLETKRHIIGIGVCFLEAETQSNHDQYKTFSRWLGKHMAYSNSEVDELVAEHNDACNFRQAKIVEERDFVLK